MKVVLVGVAELDGRTGVVWNMVRDVLQSLGPSDVLVHSGGGVKDATGHMQPTLGSIVDSIVRRAKGAEKRRLPKVEVQIPEIGRYERLDALMHNAIQLIHHQRPQVVVYVGYGEDDEARPVLEQVALYNAAAAETRVIAWQEASEFVTERGRRA